VALAPCVDGYAEIAALLNAQPTTKLKGNPYAAWIEMYAGQAYQAVAEAAIERLDEQAPLAAAMLVTPICGIRFGRQPRSKLNSGR
jgi:thiaminase